MCSEVGRGSPVILTATVNNIVLHMYYKKETAAQWALNSVLRRSLNIISVEKRVLALNQVARHIFSELTEEGAQHTSLWCSSAECLCC